MARGVKVVWNRDGYQAVLNSGGVQGEIESMAQSIKESATAMLDPDEGYKNFEDFEVKDIQGILAKGKVVRTKTDHARASQNKNGTLLKALSAGRR